MLLGFMGTDEYLPKTTSLQLIQETAEHNINNITKNMHLPFTNDLLTTHRE